MMQQHNEHQMLLAVPAGWHHASGRANQLAAAARPHSTGSGGSQGAYRRRLSAAASSAAGGSPRGCVLGGGVDMGEERAWELYECADLLVQQLSVDSEETLSWLDKADRKRELAATRQLEAGTPLPAAISAAQVQQLLEVLSGVIGMQPAGMAAFLRKWPRYLACEPAQARGVACFLREELGATASKAASLLRRHPRVLAMEADILRQRRDAWQRSLGLSDAQLAKVLSALPAPMSYTVTGIEQQSAAVLAWCCALGWTSEEITNVLLRDPRILQRDALSLQSNFDSFMGMCGLSHEEAVAICHSTPNVLVKNVATPGNKRKLDFLQQVIGRPAAALAQSPLYIARSLENVIAPRTFFWRARGRELSPSLSPLETSWPKFYKSCDCNETEFGEWLAAWRLTPEGRLWGSKVAEATAESRRQ